MLKGEKALIYLVFLLIVPAYVSAQENSTTSITLNSTNQASIQNLIVTNVIPDGFEVTKPIDYALVPTNILSLISSRDGNIYAGTNGNAIIMLNESNNLPTWERLPSQANTNVYIVYELKNGTIITTGHIPNGDRIFALDIDRKGWHIYARLPNSVYLRNFIQTKNGIQIVGDYLGGSQSYVSFDDGLSWQLLSLTGQIFDFYQASNDYYYGTIYAVTSTGLAKSIDGINWFQVDKPIIPIDNIKSIIETDDHMLIIGGDYGKLAITTNSGPVWASLPSIGETITQFYKTSNGDIYIATESGLWKSTDSTGLEYTKLFTSGPVYAMVEGKDGKLYVGANGIDSFNPIIRSTFSVSGTTSTTTTTTIPTNLYEDFSGGLDTDKWQEVPASDLNSNHIEEHYVLFNEEGIPYHTASYGPQDRGTLLVSTRKFKAGESIEYDLNYISGEGNRISIIDLDGGYILQGLIGFWNGIEIGGNDFGQYHIKVDFTSQGATITINDPLGNVKTVNYISNTDNHIFGFGTRTGHNGWVHMDYDNVYLTSPFIIETTTTSSTTTSTIVTTIPVYSRDEVDALLAERDARITALESRASLLETALSNIRNTLTTLQNTVSNLFTSLFGLPKGLREQMVCEAMIATNQTSASGFGLTCSLNDKGACSCS